MKIIPVRSRLRFHRHAPCDRQDIPCKGVGIGIGRENAPLDLKRLNRFRNSIRVAFLRSVNSCRIESAPSSAHGKLQFNARHPGGCGFVV